MKPPIQWWFENAHDARFFGKTIETPKGMVWVCAGCGHFGATAIESKGPYGAHTHECNVCKAWDKNLILFEDSPYTRKKVAEMAEELKAAASTRRTFSLALAEETDREYREGLYLNLSRCDDYLTSVRQKLKALAWKDFE